MSKKQKTTTKPWKQAQPYVLGAGNALQDAYEGSMGAIQSNTDNSLAALGDLTATLTQKYNQGNPNLKSATDYNTKVLAGEYLGKNPYINDILDQTQNRTVNSTQGALGLRGLTGGSSYADIISKNVANNASQTLYGDYSAERDRMATAAGQAPSLTAADIAQVTPILQALGLSSDIANDPLEAAGMYSGSVSGLFSPYTQTTQKQGIGTTIGGLVGSGLAGWASGGFKGI